MRKEYQQSHSVTWGRFIILSIVCIGLLIALMSTEGFYPKGWIIIVGYVLLASIILLNGFRRKLILDQECLVFHNYFRTYVVYYYDIQEVSKMTSSAHNQSGEQVNKKAYFLLKNSNGKRIIQLPWSIFKTEHERIEFLKTLEHYPNINLDYACQLILGKRNSVQDTLNIVKNLYSNYKKKNSKS